MPKNVLEEVCVCFWSGGVLDSLGEVWMEEENGKVDLQALGIDEGRGVGSVKGSCERLVNVRIRFVGLLVLWSCDFGKRSIHEDR